MNADTRTGEQILEALDFDHEVPCEIRWHDRRGDGPAIYLIHQGPTTCGHRDGREFTICAGCWTAAGFGLECPECPVINGRDKVWHIVRVIGGGS